MKELILATHNRGKVEELRGLLQDLPIRIKSLHDFPEITEIEETGSTFRENAQIKAKAVFELTGLCSLADDSGLEVDWLQGKPGIYSARYAGEQATDEDNNRKLLAELEGLPLEERSARFRSVICGFLPSGQEIYTEGICEGRIALEPVGDQGFGYDPLFLLAPDFQRTMAELPLGEKNSISHRGRAFRQLKPLITRLLKEGGF